MGEHLCLYIRQGTDKQNIQGAQKTKLPTQINEPIKKWATELNTTFSKKEVQMAKKTHEKMPTIPGHKGNANQNHTKIPTPVRIATIKNTTHNKCWQGCGDKGTLIDCWWE
jgi:hypothetical protein